jgi:hypothetical protein
MLGYLALLCGLAGGLGLAGAEERRFERAAAHEISSRLEGRSRTVSVNARPAGLGAVWGELDSVTIRARGFEVGGLPLYTEPDRSTAGKAHRLELELDDFRLRGLRVDALRATVPGCRYDFPLALRNRTFRLSRSGEGSGWVRVLDRDLPGFLLAKYPEIKRISVRVDRGHAWVEGFGEFLVVTTEFTVIARLGVRDGTKIVLEDAKVWFDWRRADALAARAVLDALNPVVDLDADLGLEGAMQVEEVELPDGAIVARGRTRIPVKAASAGNATAWRTPPARLSSGSSSPRPSSSARKRREPPGWPRPCGWPWQ